MGRAGPRLAYRSRPRTDTRARIAVLADPHVAVDAAGTWKVLHRTPERLRTAVADANARGVDFTLVAGDLTGVGTAAEFDRVDGILADLEGPWAAIPGNHDVPKSWNDHDGITVDAFAERFAPGLPFAIEAGPVTVLGIDSASDPGGRLQTSWAGSVTAEQRAWLETRLTDAAVPVVACHHNLGALPENPGGRWANFPLRDAEAVRDLLADHDVPLAVTAHHHVPAIARHGPTTELLAPATCSYPQASLLIDIGPEGTTVQLVPLADRKGVAEAHRHARSGTALGRGILSMVEAHLEANLEAFPAPTGRPES